MLQKNGTAGAPKRNPAKTLPMRGFLGEYYEDYVADDEEPSPMEAKTGLDVTTSGGLAPLVNYEAPLSELEKELRKARRLIQKAIERNDAEGCGRLLYVFVRELLGIKNLPEGLIQMRMPNRKPGRKPVPDRLKAYDAWVSFGSPPRLSTPLLSKIARMVYGDEYAKTGNRGTAGQLHQKRMRDRCQKYVERQLDAELARKEQEIARLEREIAQLKARGLAPQLPT